ncbi:MAG: transporter [Acidimicrobiales bacterium]|nr:transporter [Acidimicrobiales bacterium]
MQGRDFNWFWRAYTVSIFGDQVTLVAIPIAVFARTQSALDVGIAAAMQAATTLIFGLFAGALADRLRHRPVLIITDLVRAAVLGFLAILVIATPTYPVEAVYAVAFLLGAFGILHDATAGAALPLVVNGRDLLKANGRLSGSEAVGNAGGPVLAGALTSLSIGLAFAADAITFVLSVFGISRVRSFQRETQEPEREPASMGSEIKEGLQALRAETAVVKAVVLIAAMNVMAVAVEAQFIPFAKTVLHVGNVAICIYFAIGGAAGVLTALALGRSERTRGDAMILGAAIFGVGVLMAGLFPSKATLVFTYLAAGAGSVLAVSHWSSLRQRLFPVRLLGRVTMATRMVLFGVIPIAYVAGGALARSEGSQVLFVVAACVGLTTSLWAWLVGLGSLRVEDAVQ